MTDITWGERVSALAVNPDMATREDVARLAAELSECWFVLGVLTGVFRGDTNAATGRAREIFAAQEAK